MTDAEIRAELNRQIDLQGRCIEVDSPADGPPLILRTPKHLPQEAMARLRTAWEDCWKRDAPGPRIIVLDGGMELYQLVDGRWVKLTEDLAEPNGLDR